MTLPLDGARMGLCLACMVMQASCGCGGTGLAGDAVSEDLLLEPDGDVISAICGDGVLDEGEECDDGPDNSDTVPDACRTDCRLPFCGDWIMDSDEACDGRDFGVESCETLGLGYTGGYLLCTDACETSDERCSTCGNGIIETHEDCEGDDLGGATCESLGLAGAGLACTDACLFDTQGCYWCGNGVVEGEEQCDDGNFLNWDGCNACEVGEFIVNTTLPGDQNLPSVAVSPENRLVVVWHDEGTASGTEERYIYARSYLADGTPSGGEWRASAFPSSIPAVDVDESGRILVCWERYDDVFGKLIDFDGSALGLEFGISTWISGLYHYQPIPSFSADGSFVVVWMRGDYIGHDQYDAVGQRYDSARERIGDAFVAPESGWENRYPDVGMAPDGRFVVVWQAPEGIHGTLYDASGAVVSRQFRVSAEPRSSIGGWVAVSMNATGDFMVAWSDMLSDDPDGFGIYGRAFDENAVTTGSQLLVNTSTAGNQDRPDVGMFPDGRKVVVWESEDQDGYGYGIFGQLLDVDDVPTGSEFRLNQYASGDQKSPDLDMNASGNFSVVWQSDGQDGSSNGIVAQRFDSAGNPIGLLPW